MSVLLSGPRWRRYGGVLQVWITILAPLLMVSGLLLFWGLLKLIFWIRDKIPNRERSLLQAQREERRRQRLEDIRRRK